MLIQTMGTRVVSDNADHQPLYRYDSAPEKQEQQKLTFISLLQLFGIMSRDD